MMLCLGKKNLQSYSTRSKNESPKDIHCPPGTNTWSFWQRAKVAGKDASDNKHHETLPVEVGKALCSNFQEVIR